MDSRVGSVPSHFRRTSGFPGTNSMVWDSRERDLAWDVRNEAD